MSVFLWILYGMIITAFVLIIISPQDRKNFHKRDEAGHTIDQQRNQFRQAAKAASADMKRKS